MVVNVFIDELLPSGMRTLILWALGGLVVPYALNIGLMYIVNYWGHMLGINIETDMRRKLFAQNPAETRKQVGSI